MVYRAQALRNLAILQILFGSLMIVFGIASIAAVDHWTTSAGFGIWIGFWVVISGILGYIGAKEDENPNKCLIGCFMGFSITTCVFSAVMFICYSVALSEFSRILRCKEDWLFEYSKLKRPCYTLSKRDKASDGAGLGACLLILSILAFFVALASSIYCCKAVCCGAPAEGTVTNQQEMYVGPRQMYPGGQAGGFVIQPAGAMATVAGQQTVFIPAEQQVNDQERPPPYSYSAHDTGLNAPQSAASASGVTGNVPVATVV